MSAIMRPTKVFNAMIRSMKVLCITYKWRYLANNLVNFVVAARVGALA